MNRPRADRRGPAQVNTDDTHEHQEEGVSMRNIQFFSTDTDDGVVSVVAKTGPGEHRTVAQIPVGNAPRGGVKFTADGRGFVCNTSQNTISEIDAVALDEVRRIEVGHGPRGQGLLPGDRYLLVSNSGSDTLSVVDLELNTEVHTVPTGRDPRHMGVNKAGTIAYVCVWGDGYVAKFDVSSLAEGRPEGVTEIARIPVDRLAHPYSLGIDPSGRRVFVANTQAAYVTVIDTDTDRTHTVDVGSTGGRGVAFTPDGRHALVTVENTSSVAVIDVDTLAVTRHIPTGSGPRGLVVDPADETVYITNFARAGMMAAHPDFAPNSLTMVDLASAPLDRDEGEFRYEEITVGFGPCSVVMFDLDSLDPEERVRRLDRAASLG
ncbi:YncE family protein (plasmid) [Streptomyces sp. BI20]|uniref:YncE family protein n=1 Tax=Streptomyces sp. BI20 TaxID=3403460 RepID=UPI003C795A2D